MKRYHLFEFGDQRWLPRVFRNYLTDVLEYQASMIYRFAMPKLMRAIHQSGSKKVLDLCSGSGGPWNEIFEILEKKMPQEIEVTLSDKFPIKNWISKNGNKKLNYFPEPLDVRNVPSEIKAFRTIFTGFHHFKPKDAKQILNNAVATKNPIAIFEFTERKKEKIKFLLRHPFALYKLVPHLKPLNKSRYFWTYILPIFPLMYFWDGVVSHLRTYTEEELQLFTKDFQQDIYRWEAGQIEIPNTPFKITYLIGQPS